MTWIKYVMNDPKTWPEENDYVLCIVKLDFFYKYRFFRFIPYVTKKECEFVSNNIPFPKEKIFYWIKINIPDVPADILRNFL